MRAGLERRTTMAERVSGVPERTLHRHFLDFLGLSPLAHLRQLRLAAAREALLDPGGSASVTEVTARFGFVHLGRFSSDYRRRFGEPPTATLARGRAAAAEVAAVRNRNEAGPHLTKACGNGGGLPLQAYPAITVDRIAMTLPWFCEGRARGADGPIVDGLASLGLSL
jgi:AraC-like DNA-binding protein